MSKKQWFVRLHVDGEDNPIYREVKSYFEAISCVVEHLEKDNPFSCEVDFFYRKGEQ